jgi:hypothetical protein
VSFCLGLGVGTWTTQALTLWRSGCRRRAAMAALYATLTFVASLGMWLQGR